MVLIPVFVGFPLMQRAAWSRGGGRPWVARRGRVAGNTPPFSSPALSSGKFARLEL